MAKNQKERKLDRKLIEVYEQYGLKKFLSVCASMLNIRDTDNYKKKMVVNGEVCEVLIRVATEHYLRVKGIKGKVVHSLVLPNKFHPENNFRTEIDFTCITPYVCLVAECKSFVGEIVATDRCTLTRRSVRFGDISADVGRQDEIHCNTLVPYLYDYVRPGAGVPKPPLSSFCFMFSNGTLVDKRNSVAKNELPVLTAGQLFSYYDLLFSQHRKEVYDVQAAAKTFQAMADSRILHIQHADYLGY